MLPLLNKARPFPYKTRRKGFASCNGNANAAKKNPFPHCRVQLFTCKVTKNNADLPPPDTTFIMEMNKFAVFCTVFFHAPAAAVRSMRKVPATARWRHCEEGVFCPVCKQGFFALQTRLLLNANKASFECKEALFENRAKRKGFPRAFLLGNSSKENPIYQIVNSIIQDLVLRVLRVEIAPS